MIQVSVSVWNSKAIKVIFLRGISDESMNLIELMRDGYVSKLLIEKIGELGKKYSRCKTRKGKGPQDPLPLNIKSSSSGVTRT